MQCNNVGKLLNLLLLAAGGIRPTSIYACQIEVETPHEKSCKYQQQCKSGFQRVSTLLSCLETGEESEDRCGGMQS